MIPKGTKNIIFDLGGVILNLDYNLTVKAFDKLNEPGKSSIYTAAKQLPYFIDFEKGLITAESFRLQLKQAFPDHISQEQLDLAWNAMLLDLPPARLELLDQLRKKYRLFLLSNTNEIHFQAVTDYLHKTFGFRDFAHLFEKQYFSHIVKMRKPDTEIYKLVLDENSLLPEETLFIDDSEPNIHGALKAGIEALWLTPDITIHDVFRSI